MKQHHSEKTQQGRRLHHQFRAILDHAFGGWYSLLHQGDLVSIESFANQTGTSIEAIERAIDQGELVAFTSEEFGTQLLKEQLRSWADPGTEEDTLTTEPFLSLEDLLQVYAPLLTSLGWSCTDLLHFDNMGLLVAWQHPATRVFHFEERSWITFLEHTLEAKHRQERYQKDVEPQTEEQPPLGEWLPKAG